jgi:hypothetical protein
MKKQSSENTTALVAATQALPAAQPVNVPEEERAQLEQAYRERAARDIKRERSEINLGRGMVLVTGGAALAFSGIGLPLGMTVLFGGVFGTLGGLLGTVCVSAEHKLQQRLADGKREWAETTLREAFVAAQRDSYTEQKKLVAAAAEQYLGAGNLIGMAEAGWLAALTPGLLEEATDQLAVTVFQMRRMLAHMRCASFNSDGSRRISAPLTFAAMQFSPAAPLHRAILREKLADADCPIAEDDLPLVKEPELAEPVRHKAGVLKSMASFLLFRTRGSLRREFVESAMPRFKDVETPVLAPVADFAELLEAYEARNPQLDLPALRGWKGGARRALPAPAAL